MKYYIIYPRGFKLTCVGSCSTSKKHLPSFTVETLYKYECETHFLASNSMIYSYKKHKITKDAKELKNFLLG